MDFARISPVHYFYMQIFDRNLDERSTSWSQTGLIPMASIIMPYSLVTEIFLLHNLHTASGFCLTIVIMLSAIPF